MPGEKSERPYVGLTLMSCQVTAKGLDGSGGGSSDNDDDDDVKLNLNGAQIVFNWLWLGLPRVGALNTVLLRPLRQIST